MQAEQAADQKPAPLRPCRLPAAAGENHKWRVRRQEMPLPNIEMAREESEPQEPEGEEQGQQLPPVVIKRKATSSLRDHDRDRPAESPA